ncbi:winged helix-turn-helix domain-containing tetratricopeptide repeat protein [Dongia deserti]|uniref:winged helix-turn-helix domain-containing tetratricopeptide repeat protein n=1 Tax=Dongia deserti TaxID=2268030 RepID=UPI000E65158C|nr:winged helix-turn-helix domain-containing protein [Dongia deserti]
MADSICIQFGDCEIDVAGFALYRNGQPSPIEPQVLELLLYLVRHPDRLITRDDLIKHVWHGRIVSDTTVTSRVKSARKAIGDDGSQQKFIRTVHGRGVRFIAPVRTRACRTGADIIATGGAPSGNAAPRAAARPSWPAIAVLPFANLGNDADQDHFADGVTEDIITDLSRFRELRVVARDSCFRFRTPGADLQAIGRDLSADYVVTGSIRRRGAKLRLTAQLTQTDSGEQLWAERFDRNAEDLFALSDELVRTIAGTLVGRVRSTGSALARRKAPANLAAYECVLRGQAAQALIGEPAQETAARQFFEQALALDPDYPRAHAGLAVVLLCEWFRTPDDAQALLDRALEHAEKAVAMDPEDYECRETLGWILLHCKSYELSELHYRRAIELNPNSPAELAAMGSACSFLGRPDEGIQWFELARRVDPYFDATWYWNLLGATYFNARRYDDAVVALDRVTNPPAWVKAYSAASHAMAGRIDAARDITAALAKDAPSFCARAIVRKEPYRNPADLAHLAEGLSKAGLLTETPGTNHEDRDIDGSSQYYLTGRSPFIHGLRGKPTFRASS